MREVPLATYTCIKFEVLPSYKGVSSRLLLPQCFQRLITNAKSHPRVAVSVLFYMCIVGCGSRI